VPLPTSGSTMCPNRRIDPAPHPSNPRKRSPLRNVNVISCTLFLPARGSHLYRLDQRGAQ
jgi:hypothetical protein